MLVALIKCPRTDRHVSTGIETTDEGFEQPNAAQPPVQCPFCGKEHRWAACDAILVPPDRWSDVPEIEDCFLKAMENADRAAESKSYEQREFYLRMERKWLGLAEGYRFISEVERRYGDANRPSRALLKSIKSPSADQVANWRVPQELRPGGKRRLDRRR